VKQKFSLTEISDLIKSLQDSKLNAKCSYCRKSSPLSKYVMFDGTKDFSNDIQKIVDQYETSLQEKHKKLEKKIIKTDEGSEQKAIDVGFGKTMEKIIHLHKDFDVPLDDCRFLAEPLDVIVFNGSSKNKVDHITFMEIKTGAARLNAHQKMIRDAVQDNNVLVEKL
jgi:predicted Holliday junction resolvase-like endonuclease